MNKPVVLPDWLRACSSKSLGQDDPDIDFRMLSDPRDMASGELKELEAFRIGFVRAAVAAKTSRRGAGRFFPADTRPAFAELLRFLKATRNAAITAVAAPLMDVSKRGAREDHGLCRRHRIHR